MTAFVLFGALLLQGSGTDFPGLDRRPADRWQVRFSGTVPSFSGSIIFPLPPDDPGQTIPSCNLTVRVSGRLVETRRIEEASPLAQKVLIVDVPDPSSVSVQVDVVAQLYETALGKPAVPPPMPATHRRAYLDCRWEKPEHREWFGRFLDSAGLRRAADEADIAFARRTLDYLARHFTYRIPDDEPAYRAAIRKHGEFSRWQYMIDTRSGECWRLSDLYANILRTADIPVRVVSGNLVARRGHHLRTLVWLKDHGWLPVEPTAAVSARQADPYFGAWAEPMLNGNAQIWLSIPTSHGRFNIGTIDWPWFYWRDGRFTHLGDSMTARRL